MTSEDSKTPESATAQLTASSAKWMADAMVAWANDDYERVAVQAPLAVELLGKAVLWSKNPALLVPLAPNSEHSLINLAISPDLTDQRLRTVGLAILLDRLELVLGSLPVDKKRRGRLIAIRNGAVHVGNPDQSRHTLTDSLELCTLFLSVLGTEPENYFEDQRWNVKDLLTKGRSEIAQKVSAKRAQARNHLWALEQRLAPEIFEETTNSLEASARDAINPEDYGSGFGASDHPCPECGSVGLLLGRIDIDSTPDFDVEPLGNGHYSTYIAGMVAEASVAPDTFACNVCRLTLSGRDELSECNIDSSYHTVDVDSLGEGALYELSGFDWN